MMRVLLIVGMVLVVGCGGPAPDDGKRHCTGGAADACLVRLTPPARGAGSSTVIESRQPAINLLVDWDCSSYGSSACPATVALVATTTVPVRFDSAVSWTDHYSLPIAPGGGFGWKDAKTVPYSATVQMLSE